VHDPVFVAALLALLRGDTQPQQQSITDTVDDTVLASCEGFEQSAASPEVIASGPDGTDIQVCPGLVLRVRRVLGGDAPATDGVGGVSATWQNAGGTPVRDVFAVLLAG
jgi:hypothetical protein